MTGIRIGLVLGGVLVAGLAGIYSLRSREGYVTGIVHDVVSKTPVAGVDLTLDCIRSKVLEGSESVGTMRARTAQDGSYVLARSWVRKCAYVGATPEKVGYRDASLIEHSGVTAGLAFNPPRAPDVWLVKNTEIHHLQLQRLYDDSTSVRKWPKGPMPLHDYLMVNAPFHESVKVASVPAEIGWVQDHYCTRLAVLWEALSEGDRQALQRYSGIESHDSVVGQCHTE